MASISKHPYYSKDQLRQILTEVLKYDYITREHASKIAGKLDPKIAPTGKRVSTGRVYKIAEDAGLADSRFLLMEEEVSDEEIIYSKPVLDESLIEKVIAGAVAREFADELADASDPERQRINALAERVDRATAYMSSGETPRYSNSNGGSNWLLYLICGLVALIIFVFLQNTPSRTSEESLIEAMKQGQRDVCKKWGDLRPECR